MNGHTESSSSSIASRAHEIWEKEGRPEGRAQEHWLKAEKELKVPAKKAKAASKSKKAASKSAPKSAAKVGPKAVAKAGARKAGSVKSAQK